MSAKDYYNGSSGAGAGSYAPPQGAPPAAGNDTRGFGGYGGGYHQQGYGQPQGGYYVRPHSY